MSLIIKKLTGGYSTRPVIKNIDFEIQAGEMVGLIGLNGAGKSTTLKHVMGLMKAFSGEIELDGIRLEEYPTAFRKNVAYIPESPILYEELTLREHIELTRLAYDLADDADTDAEVERLLKLFRLEERLDWFPIHFSKGMQQKVMIVQALILKSACLIIDEPFIGLDPLAIRDLLSELKKRQVEGAKILMSTHVLATAEKYCDRFIVLDEGEVIAKGTMEELQKQYGQSNVDLDDLYFRMTEGGRADDTLND